jgi:protein-serine/threonine kinase
MDEDVEMMDAGGSPVHSSAAEISKSSEEKAAIAKFRLENFYDNIVSECKDREQRWKDLEQKISSEAWSEERKQRQLASLGRRESEFLRLKRTRLTVDDFNTLKVIGKGAFGEVYISSCNCPFGEHS